MAANNHVSVSPKKEYQASPPSIDLGAVFGDNIPSRGGSASHSPYERGLEFAIKFAPLSVIELILSIGIAWRAGWDVSMWLCLFGLLIFAGFWMLSFVENVFEPTSGHVVRYFFSWLVARQYIASNERLAQQTNQLEYLRQFNAWQEQRVLEMKTSLQVEKHSQPQHELNRFANYQASPELPTWTPGNEYKYPEDILEDLPVFKDEARQVVLDFTGDLYTSGLLNEAGYIDNQEVTVPWSKKGRQQFEPELRKLVQSLADDLSDLFSYDDEKRQWRVNVRSYPTVDSAIEYIDTVPTRKVG